MEQENTLTNSPSLSEETNCSNCSKPLNKADVYCGNCGYPENGSEQEQRKFNYSKKLKQDVIEDAKKKLKNVKIVLYIMAGVNVIALFYYFYNNAMAEVIGSIVGACVFIACALWVNKKPLIAVLSAFGFWLLLQVLSAFLEPGTIIQGLLLKIIVVSIFIKGIKSAKDYKNYTAKINFA